MTTEHIIGDTYYTAQGEKVYLDAVTTDGKLVVSQIMRYTDYGDDFYEDVGPSKVVDKLFVEAPVVVLDERFAEAEARLNDIESKYQTRYAEVINAEREIKGRLDKLKKFKGLELLEDFIDKKVTHFVYRESDTSFEYRIFDFNKAVETQDRDSYRHPFRLVTLFGDSKGDLNWKVDRYYDGSGGSTATIWPCRDEQHAKDTITAIHTDRLNEQFSYLDPQRPYWFLRSYEAATKHGIAPTAEQEAKYLECRAAELAGQEKSAREAVEKAQAALDALLSKKGQVQANG